MGKKFLWALFLAIVAATAFNSQALSAKEDTAQLTFAKTAISKKPVQSYTVQKDDVLSAIIRKLPGVTEKDIPDYYRIIKELNPQIEDLNTLSVGQKILLPGKSIAVTEEKKSAADIAGPTRLPEQTSPQVYQVRKGDNLIRIVHRELHITSRTQKTMLLIKSLNPSLTDAHRIYVGQVIRLPKVQTAERAGEQPFPPTTGIETDARIVPLPDQQQAQTENTAKGKDAIVLSPAQRLAVIRHIVTQMKGNMLTSGNYYLPVSKTEQLTIDCSIIPVVELDGRTTVFLDLENRSSSHLKRIISSQWKDYHLVKIDSKDDIIIILKKIFQHAKSYELSKSEKPSQIGSAPQLEIMVDWLITKKNEKKTPAITQGIRFVYENNPLLPRAVVNYARWHSFIITEISPNKGLVGKPEEIYSLPPVTVLPASPARDFAYALLEYLNVPAQKDIDVRVFNIAQDGFNLSIKADIVVTRGEKKTIIFSRSLPPQFVNILQKAGNELIFISDQDEPVKNMEKILRGFNFAFASGYFTFSGLDKNQPPYTFGFSGTKIKTDKDVYAVHFEFNHELRGLMQEAWSANIVQY